MIFAELCCGIPLCFQYLGQCRVDLLDAAGRTGDADCSHAGANRHLSHDKSRTSGCATWLAIVVSKKDAFIGYAINVWGSTHHAMRVGSDIPHSNVVAEDNEDIGFPILCEDDSW